MSLSKYQHTLSEIRKILFECRENDLIDTEHCLKNILTPVKLAVFASFSVGKSTFLNAFIFKDRVLHMGIGETTKKVFSISYGDVNTYNNKPFKDMRELSERIKTENDQDPAAGPWFIDIKANLDNLQDLVVIDTPGFGGLKEEKLNDAISIACKEADGFLFLFDVAKGASADDIEKYKKYIEIYDKKTTIWTIFNKLDAEDDKTEVQICSLIAKTLVDINVIEASEQAKYDSYEKLATKKAFAISSKKFLDASAGTVIKGGGEKKIDEKECKNLLLESRGKFFSERFYSEITQNKLLVLKNRIHDCVDEIDINISTLNNALTNSTSEREYLEKNMLEDINFLNTDLATANKAKTDLVKLVPELKSIIDYLNSFSFEQSISAVKVKMIHSLEINILDELKKYQLIGGDSTEVLVSRGVKNAEKGFSKIIQDEFAPTFQNIASLVAKISTSVDLYNKNSKHKQKLQSINALKYEQLGQMTLEIKNKTHDFVVDENDTIGDAVINTILGTIGAVIAGLVAEYVAAFIAQRLAVVLIPGLGWAIGGVLLLISIFGGKNVGDILVEKVTPKLRELLSKEVAPEIATKLKYEFKTKINKDLVAIKNQLESNISILDMHTATNAKELREKREKLEKTMAELTDKINTLIKKVSEFEVCKQKLKSLTL
jgi:signal recognition particle receptor subunit beta